MPVQAETKRKAQLAMKEVRPAADGFIILFSELFSEVDYECRARCANRSPRTRHRWFSALTIVDSAENL
jgi:hypothetical protein